MGDDLEDDGRSQSFGTRSVRETLTETNVSTYI